MNTKEKYEFFEVYVFRNEYQWSEVRISVINKSDVAKIHMIKSVCNKIVADDVSYKPKNLIADFTDYLLNLDYERIITN